MLAVLVAFTTPMPPRKAHLKRSGDHARGGAKISQYDVPNPCSTEYRETIKGQFASTKALLTHYDKENTMKTEPPAAADASPATSKRPAKKQAKSTQLIARHQARREKAAVDLLKKEEAAAIFFIGVLNETINPIYADREKNLKPIAEELGYNLLHLNDKYNGLRIYSQHRIDGLNATMASDLAGMAIGVTGKSIRRWRDEFFAETTKPLKNVPAKPKKPLYFDVMAQGGNHKSLFENEEKQAKARKWVAKNAEVNGAPNMTVEAFRDFLVGEYDGATSTWLKVGLLAEELKAAGKTSLSLDAARSYLHVLGYKFGRAGKGIYADGHDRKDVKQYEQEVYLPWQLELEKRTYHWVPLAWLEKVDNWRKYSASPDAGVAAHRKWVTDGKPEVHIDDFEWKSIKTPDGVDRITEWGPMGGVLRRDFPAGEKPYLEVLQDESIGRAHDGQTQAWRRPGVAAGTIRPKGDGAGLMLAGFVMEACGGVPTLSEAEIDAYNRQAPADEQVTLAALKAEGMLTEVDAAGKPVPGTGKASQLYKCPALAQLEIGKAKEGYWTGEMQVAQTVKLHRMLEIKYPGHVFVYVFDWSSGHHAFAADALVAKRFNAKPGGKQPIMRDTTFLASEAGANVVNCAPVPGSQPLRYAQKSAFSVGDKVLCEKEDRVLAAADPLVGQAKGAIQFAKERDIFVTKMTMDGPKLTGEALTAALAAQADEVPDEEHPARGDGEDDESEDAAPKDKTPRNKALSLVHALSEQSDFANEKSLLEQEVTKLGGKVTWLPKFHAQCNGIEYVWGNSKMRTRANCDYKMASLRTAFFTAVFTIEPALTRKYFRKARLFQRALRDGADAFTMHLKVVKMKKERHASHRRAAPSQYQAE